MFVVDCVSTAQTLISLYCRKGSVDMAHRVNDAGENVTASEIEEHGSQESKKSGLSLRAVIICFLQVKTPHFCRKFSPGTGGEFLC